MPWPLTILNAVNRHLREEVGRVTSEICERQKACEEYEEVTGLLRENLRQVSRQVSLEASTLQRLRDDTEAMDGKTKQLQLEAESAGKIVQSCSAEAKRLTRMVEATEAAMTQRREALRRELQKSKDLEDEMRLLVRGNKSREEHGKTLERELKRLSHHGWANLEVLSRKVAEAEAALAAERAEQNGVLQTLESVQASLRSRLSDHQESLTALTFLSQQKQAIDRLIVVNGEEMTELHARSAAQMERRRQLQRALSDAQEKRQRLMSGSAGKRKALDQRWQQAREVAGQLQELAKKQASARCHRRSELQHKEQLATRLSHAQATGEDLCSVHDTQRCRLQALREASREAERIAGRESLPSSSVLYELGQSLRLYNERLDERVAVVQRRLTEAVEATMVVAQRGEGLNDAITRAQEDLQKSCGVQQQVQTQQSQLRDVATSLESHLERVRECLPGARAAMTERLLRRRGEHEIRVKTLRGKLSEATNRYHQLLRETTSLRSAVCRSSKLIHSCRDDQVRVVDKVKVMEAEVAQLQTEETQMEGTRRTHDVSLSRAQVTLNTLYAAGRQVIDACKAATGLGELFSAQVQVELDKLSAERQARLLELHLEQNAHSEQLESLRRQVKRRDLLRGRYTEMMASLARSLQAPQEHRAGASSTGIAVSEGAPAEYSTPEALHARLILQRSCERERLMERGNFLDLRLVSLEKETRMLHTTLDALKAERQAPLSEAEPLGTRIARSRSAQVGGKERGAGVRASNDGHCSQRVELGQPGAPVNPSRDGLAACMASRDLLLRVELQIQQGNLSALGEQREQTNRQLESLRSELKELRGVEKKKRTQIQRLSDQLKQTQRAPRVAHR